MMDKPQKKVLQTEEGLGFRHYQMDREYVDTWNSCCDDWEEYLDGLQGTIKKNVGKITQVGIDKVSKFQMDSKTVGKKWIVSELEKLSKDWRTEYHIFKPIDNLIKKIKE